MLTLNDGPAKGSYAVKRAPDYLRAVVSQFNGKADVLDQLEDTPAPREAVYVYRRITDVGWVHLNMGSIRRGTGRYVMAGYEHMPDVDGQALRENAAWQAWALAQPEPQRNASWLASVPPVAPDTSTL